MLFYCFSSPFPIVQSYRWPLPETSGFFHPNHLLSVLTVGVRHPILSSPLGDMAATITTLIMGNPGIDFVYSHQIDGNEYRLDTREIREEMEDLSLSDPIVIHHLAETIRSALEELSSNQSES